MQLSSFWVFGFLNGKDLTRPQLVQLVIVVENTGIEIGGKYECSAYACCCYCIICAEKQYVGY